jgi:hypothetical protein
VERVPTVWCGTSSDGERYLSPVQKVCASVVSPWAREGCVVTGAPGAVVEYVPYTVRSLNRPRGVAHVGRVDAMVGRTPLLEQRIRRRRRWRGWPDGHGRVALFLLQARTVCFQQAAGLARLGLDLALTLQLTRDGIQHEPPAVLRGLAQRQALGLGIRGVPTHVKDVVATVARAGLQQPYVQCELCGR